MLNSEQINYLFQFCEKKFVRYYDVQLELVDHLANAIERKMESQPEINFEEALKTVYKDFGIFGFAHIVQEKEANVYNTQRKIFRQLVKEQFQWPKIILFVATTILFLNIFSAFGKVSFEISSTFLLILAFIVSIIAARGIRKIRTKAKKKLTLTNFLYGSSWIYLPIYLFNFSGFFNFFESLEYQQLSILQNIFFSVCSSLYIVILIAHYQTFLGIKKEVINKYPELFVIVKD